MQEPDARFEAKVVIGQRPDRANLGDVAGVRVVERRIADGADAYVIAAPKELQLARLGDVLEEADAARALDAALLIEHHRAEVNGLRLADFERRRDLAGVQAVDHVVVLQAALAGLVADRAIYGMVDEQKLQHATHRRLDALV